MRRKFNGVGGKGFLAGLFFFFFFFFFFLIKN